MLTSKLRQTEIQNLRSSITGDEDIFWLQISMEDALGEYFWHPMAVCGTLGRLTQCSTWNILY